MAKSNQDFTIHETADFALYFEMEDDSELDLSAVTAAEWRMGLSVTPDSGDVSKTLGSGITAVTEATHIAGKSGTVDKLKVVVADTDTTGLGGTTASGTSYYHELRITNASGATGVVAYGTALILPSNTG